MAIPVQCPECHKRYQAPDHLAGRRVKCKYCGVAFLIAADSRTESPDFELGQLDELAALAETGKQDALKRGGTIAGGAAVGHKSPAAAATGAAAGAAVGGGEDIDDLFQRNDFVEGPAPRTNKLYVFPLSRLLDHWLPPVLLAIGVLWMIREPWDRNDTGRTWVGIVRAAVFLLALFASVWPFTLMGVRAAARKLNYEMPPKPALRVLGTFAVPAALVAALWLIYGDVTGLLLGTVTGIVVALPVLFLLLRLLPHEAPVTFAYAAGSFVLSVVVAVAAVFALNLMLVGILRSLRTDHELAVSPFGPGLRWELPQARKDAIAAVTNGGDGAEVGTDAETPATRPDAGAADTRPADTRPADGVATTQRTVGSGSGSAGALVQGNAASPGNTAGRSTPAVTAPPVGPPAAGADATATARADASPAGPGEGGGVPFIPEAPPNANAKAASEIVREVKTVLQGQDVDQIVRPVLPGPWLAVVRPEERGIDRVERWSTQEWKAAGEARVARAPQGNHYALSPDGDLLAYVSDFPSLSVQVWSFGANRTVRQITLNNPNGATPHLLGFSRPDQVVVHWRLPGVSGLEVFNAKTFGPSRRIEVVDFEPSPGRFAFSPDGQSLAVITRGQRQAALATYLLNAGRGSAREVPINEVDWNYQIRPTALTYTPDGTRVTALLESRGRALFASWPASGRVGKATSQHVLAGGLQPPADANGFAPTFSGSAMEWLDDGETYLLYGSSVIDAKDGTFLGELGIGGVAAQEATGPGVVELVRPTEDGQTRIDRVTLDMSKVREARRGNGAANGGSNTGGVAAPNPTPQKPATRRSANANGSRGGC